jgi:hypothetical protein
MASRLNNDGLRIWYAAEEARDAVVFESTSDGQSRVTEIRVDHSWLPLVAQNDEVASYDYRLPAGAVISKVEILPLEDFNSADDGELLNVGITDADGGTTIFDTDALVVAATQTELNAGGENTAGWVGTRVNGTPLEEDVFITWEVDVSQPTAGAALIRVYWQMPFPTTDTLVWSKA